MLICKFVSRRSDPNRIRVWLDYLAELERRYVADAEATSTLRLLRNEAQAWLSANAPQAE